MGFPGADLFYAEQESADHALPVWVGVEPCEMTTHPICEVVWYGSEDEPIAAVAVRETHRETSNWNVGRTVIKLPEPSQDDLWDWGVAIRDFCERNGIPYDGAAVGWHLAVDDR